MNTKFTTLSADGLRFEFELTQEARAVRPSENLITIADAQASSKNNSNSHPELMEELMILGR